MICPAQLHLEQHHFGTSDLDRIENFKFCDESALINAVDDAYTALIESFKEVDVVLVGYLELQAIQGYCFVDFILLSFLRILQFQMRM